MALFAEEDLPLFVSLGQPRGNLCEYMRILVWRQINGPQRLATHRATARDLR